ncbi:MAG: glycosyltransferase [Alteromonadaceae bacterium]|nr:glycosyltransferase [Alteromonadaceae bacterium]
MCYQSPVVSVVIPMYNVVKFIARALDSVLAQTYEHYEVICVDDGGTDNTLDIVNSYEDTRIRVVSQRNRGLSGARNTGINEARGRYVALLDADDFWAPEKLELHVKHLNRNPDVGISYSPSLFVDEDGNELGIGQFPKLTDIDAKHVFCRNPIGNGSAPVIRRSVFWEVCKEVHEKHSIRRTYFDENMRQSEDIEFWLRVALETPWKLEGIEQAVTFYTVNAGGLSANLEKQFAAWEYAVEKNRATNPQFFKRWEPLARAYQFRYLARRAVQSGSTTTALRFMVKAFASNANILVEEPKRTILTLGCTVLSALPRKSYLALENYFMQRSSRIALGS